MLSVNEHQKCVIARYYQFPPHVKIEKAPFLNPYDITDAILHVFVLDSRHSGRHAGKPIVRKSFRGQSKAT